ncbi:AsmA protein [Roseovarius litoreus]|uniref:AsmA protein n=1 Tax=Roseovarius litoreus TaxID=1155722 RepID=A0A1M7FZ92_9RHOB|nr:AsmA family protein [Roseovarius litoreus]SHM09300.1 AsmA protein [Roseovarius litoreus]
MRWLLRLVGLVIVLVVVAVASLLLLPGDRIAKIAAEQISAATGRDVIFSGRTTISFYPVLGVSTGEVLVANAGWSDAGPMLEADSLKIGVEPVALFGGEIRITGLEAVNPRVLLERAADGRVNWEIGVEGVAPSGQSAPGQPAARSERLALTLDRALITDAHVTYSDHGTGETLTLQNINLDLRWPDYDGAATFEASAKPAGSVVTISGELDQVGTFIAGGVTDLSATISTSGGAVDFDGRAGLLPQLGGRLSADLSDTAAFLAAFGVSGVDIPRGMGRAISVATDITFSEDMRLSLRDSALALDDNRLTGAADIFLGGDRPRLNAQLTAKSLDFSALAAGQGASATSGTSQSGSGSGGSVPTDGWPKTAIDASALGLADGEVALVADSIDLGDLKLGKTRTLATLTQSRLVFALREVQAYDGNITGEFVLNNRSGLSVGGKMTAAGINLETFLRDAVDISRFSAKADGEVSFLGVGQSLHAIMNSLEGSGGLRTGRGVISGIDLDKLMRSGDVSGGTTVFDSLGASFTMQAGNLFNNDLLLSLPFATARGEGRIGLGARDLDYTFTPTLLEGDTRKGLAIPVRIRGPWANPRITPDLEAAIDLNFKEQKDELKAKAKEEVNRAVQKELGVTVEQGQSVEDAIKNKVEDELKKELFKLFD